MVKLYLRLFGIFRRTLTQEWLAIISNSLLQKQTLVCSMKQCYKRRASSMFTWYSTNTSLDDTNFRLRAVKRRDHFDVYFCHSRSSVALIWDGARKPIIFTYTYHDDCRSWLCHPGAIFSHLFRRSNASRCRQTDRAKGEHADAPRLEGEQEQADVAEAGGAESENSDEKELGGGEAPSQNGPHRAWVPKSLCQPPKRCWYQSAIFNLPEVFGKSTAFTCKSRKERWLFQLR